MLHKLIAAVLLQVCISSCQEYTFDGAEYRLTDATSSARGEQVVVPLLVPKSRWERLSRGIISGGFQWTVPYYDAVYTFSYQLANNVFTSTVVNNHTSINLDDSYASVDLNDEFVMEESYRNEEDSNLQQNRRGSYNFRWHPGRRTQKSNHHHEDGNLYQITGFAEWNNTFGGTDIDSKVSYRIIEDFFFQDGFSADITSTYTMRDSLGTCVGTRKHYLGLHGYVEHSETCKGSGYAFGNDPESCVGTRHLDSEGKRYHMTVTCEGSTFTFGEDSVSWVSTRTFDKQGKFQHHLETRNTSSSFGGKLMPYCVRTKEFNLRGQFVRHELECSNKGPSYEQWGGCSSTVTKTYSANGAVLTDNSHSPAHACTSASLIPGVVGSHDFKCAVGFTGRNCNERLQLIKRLKTRPGPGRGRGRD